MVKVITEEDGKIIGVAMTFYSEPVAQGRPRFSSFGKFARAYDPKKSRDYKSRLCEAAQDVYRERPDFKPFETALGLRVHAYRSIPKSFSKKKHEDALKGVIRPTTKPDSSNYLKSIEDGLNGVLWKDDSQITALA